MGMRRRFDEQFLRRRFFHGKDCRHCADGGGTAGAGIVCSVLGVDVRAFGSADQHRFSDLAVQLNPRGVTAAVRNGSAAAFPWRF